MSAIPTEAFANAARHSGCATAEVRLRLVEEAIELQISDDGAGFDLAQRDLARRPGPFEPEGRGLYLINAVMDSVEICCVGGTLLTMRKRIRRRLP